MSDVVFAAVRWAVADRGLAAYALLAGGDSVAAGVAESDVERLRWWMDLVADDWSGVPPTPSDLDRLMAEISAPVDGRGPPGWVDRPGARYPDGDPHRIRVKGRSRKELAALARFHQRAITNEYSTLGTMFDDRARSGAPFTDAEQTMVLAAARARIAGHRSMLRALVPSSSGVAAENADLAAWQRRLREKRGN